MVHLSILVTPFVISSSFWVDTLADLDKLFSCQGPLKFKVGSLLLGLCQGF